MDGEMERARYKMNGRDEGALNVGCHKINRR